MQIRRDRTPKDTKSLSYKVTLTTNDLRKVLMQFGNGLRAVGLPVATRHDLESVFRGAYFVCLKDYQSRELISWCVDTSIREGYLRPVEAYADRFIVISE